MQTIAGATTQNVPELQELLWSPDPEIWMSALVACERLDDPNAHRIPLERVLLDLDIRGAGRVDAVAARAGDHVLCDLHVG